MHFHCSVRWVSIGRSIFLPGGSMFPFGPQSEAMTAVSS
jgi:hypothetical protein